jgi:hypothetical protein
MDILDLRYLAAAANAGNFGVAVGRSQAGFWTRSGLEVRLFRRLIGS